MADENISRSPGDKKSEPIGSLHTLTRDTRQFLEKKNISLSALIAQSQQYEKAKEEKRFSYGTYLLASFVFLLALGGGAFWFFSGYFAEDGAGTSSPKRPEPLFPVFETREIKVSIQPQDFIGPFRAILAENILPGRMVGVVALNKNTGIDLTLTELLSLANVKIPQSLQDSLGRRHTLGVLGTIRGTEPVLIIPIVSFEKTLAGMLELEKQLPGAFFNLLPTDHPDRQFEVFKDSLIKNQEARVLISASDEPLFAYSFFARKILILAVTKDALETVIDNFLLIPPVL